MSDSEVFFIDAKTTEADVYEALEAYERQDGKVVLVLDFPEYAGRQDRKQMYADIDGNLNQLQIVKDHVYQNGGRQIDSVSSFRENAVEKFDLSPNTIYIRDKTGRGRLLIKRREEEYMFPATDPEMTAFQEMTAAQPKQASATAAAAQPPSRPAAAAATSAATPAAPPPPAEAPAAAATPASSKAAAATAAAATPARSLFLPGNSSSQASSSVAASAAPMSFGLGLPKSSAPLLVFGAPVSAAVSAASSAALPGFSMSASQNRFPPVTNPSSAQTTPFPGLRPSAATPAGQKVPAFTAANSTAEQRAPAFTAMSFGAPSPHQSFDRTSLHGQVVFDTPHIGPPSTAVPVYTSTRSFAPSNFTYSTGPFAPTPGQHSSMFLRMPSSAPNATGGNAQFRPPPEFFDATGENARTTASEAPPPSQVPRVAVSLTPSATPTDSAADTAVAAAAFSTSAAPGTMGQGGATPRKPSAAAGAAAANNGDQVDVNGERQKIQDELLAKTAELQARREELAMMEADLAMKETEAMRRQPGGNLPGQTLTDLETQIAEDAMSLQTALQAYETAKKTEQNLMTQRTVLSERILTLKREVAEATQATRTAKVALDAFGKAGATPTSVPQTATDADVTVLKDRVATAKKTFEETQRALHKSQAEIDAWEDQKRTLVSQYDREARALQEADAELNASRPSKLMADSAASDRAGNPSGAAGQALSTDDLILAEPENKRLAMRWTRPLAQKTVTSEQLNGLMPCNTNAHFQLVVAWICANDNNRVASMGLSKSSLANAVSDHVACVKMNDATVSLPVLYRFMDCRSLGTSKQRTYVTTAADRFTATVTAEAAAYEMAAETTSEQSSAEAPTVPTLKWATKCLDSLFPSTVASIFSQQTPMTSDEVAKRFERTPVILCVEGGKALATTSLGFFLGALLMSRKNILKHMLKAERTALMWLLSKTVQLKDDTVGDGFVPPPAGSSAGDSGFAPPVQYQHAQSDAYVAAKQRRDEIVARLDALRTQLDSLDKRINDEKSLLSDLAQLHEISSRALQDAENKSATATAQRQVQTMTAADRAKKLAELRGEYETATTIFDTKADELNVEDRQLGALDAAVAAATEEANRADDAVTAARRKQRASKEQLTLHKKKQMSEQKQRVAQLQKEIATQEQAVEEAALDCDRLAAQIAALERMLANMGTSGDAPDPDKEAAPQSSARVFAYSVFQPPERESPGGPTADWTFTVENIGNYEWNTRDIDVYNVASGAKMDRSAFTEKNTSVQPKKVVTFEAPASKLPAGANIRLQTSIPGVTLGGTPVITFIDQSTGGNGDEEESQQNGQTGAGERPVFAYTVDPPVRKMNSATKESEWSFKVTNTGTVPWPFGYFLFFDADQSDPTPVKEVIPMYPKGTVEPNQTVEIFATSNTKYGGPVREIINIRLLPRLARDRQIAASTNPLIQLNMANQRAVPEFVDDNNGNGGSSDQPLSPRTPAGRQPPPPGSQQTPMSPAVDKFTKADKFLAFFYKEVSAQHELSKTGKTQDPAKMRKQFATLSSMNENTITLDEPTEWVRPSMAENDNPRATQTTRMNQAFYLCIKRMVQRIQAIGLTGNPTIPEEFEEMVTGENAKKAIYAAKVLGTYRPDQTLTSPVRQILGRTSPEKGGLVEDMLNILSLCANIGEAAVRIEVARLLWNLQYRKDFQESLEEAIRSKPEDAVKEDDDMSKENTAKKASDTRTLFQDATDKVYQAILDKAVERLVQDDINTKVVRNAVADILSNFRRMGVPEQLLMATDIGDVLRTSNAKRIPVLVGSNAQRQKLADQKAEIQRIGNAIAAYIEELKYGAEVADLSKIEMDACRALYAEFSAPVAAAINGRLANEGADIRLEVIPIRVSTRKSAAQATKLGVALRVIDEAQVEGATSEDGEREGATAQSPFRRIARGASGIVDSARKLLSRGTPKRRQTPPTEPTQKPK